MLHKIVFQDNLFQITRMLDVIKEGLSLDLSDSIFAEKTIRDILFFDAALQKLFSQIEPQSHLPDYIDTMSCLYFCIKKYMTILKIILTEKIGSESAFTTEKIRLEGIYKKHQDFLGKINIDISDTNFQNETYNIVSQNELSELLNFR
ncbi:MULTISPECIES: hypothetical protein [unclassified Treponema]|uniref:hypothetical protein n=1 Tax=unclassified Treponema TaxID=2638727 RepID=UPI0020A325A2|nr:MULTISPECIES: hypothetical protein [unclassified Treponema]UTC67607.1 hypothetical protein E4O06_02755 [Treponema sp. OMZ 789]UTC70334.1 hypothetical protein E4O01_02745 [Treponema sp. OMZ 790]UTC73049.1 hypothetical protein E4O02_02745 [Treponema sp. OMZ 791]